MSEKYTAGPWVLHPTALHPAVRSVGDSMVGPKRICTVGSMNGNSVDQANARLIAAAPDLLEALESFLRAPSVGSNGPGSSTIVVQEFNLRAARAAIAKATGEAA